MSPQLKTDYDLVEDFYSVSLPLFQVPATSRNMYLLEKINLILKEFKLEESK